MWTELRGGSQRTSTLEESRGLICKLFGDDGVVGSPEICA